MLVQANVRALFIIAKQFGSFLKMAVSQHRIDRGSILLPAVLCLSGAEDFFG